MKNLIITALIMLMAGCANLGNVQKQAAAQPTVEQQKPTAEQQKTAEQLKKVFDAGVYWGSVSLGELSMTDEYKGKPVPMEIIVKTAWAKMADAQKQAAVKTSSKPADNGGEK